MYRDFRSDSRSVDVNPAPPLRVGRVSRTIVVTGTMADVEGKKLTELRVIDLKTELERRGLDKSGNKAALLDRLSKVSDILVSSSSRFSALECRSCSKSGLSPLILSI